MYRFSTTCLGIAAVVAFACGAPAELDDSLFPASYAGDETGSASGGSGQLGGGSSGAVGVGGAPGLGGSGAPVGTSGAPPVVSGGSAGAPVAAGGSGPAPGGECPDDITLIFNRPSEAGGCAGGLCHQPGGTGPDLVSPDPLSRLANATSANCNGMSYLGTGPEDSLLYLKVTTPPQGCGLAMPFGMQDALSPEDEACILEWVQANTGG